MEVILLEMRELLVNCLNASIAGLKGDQTILTESYLTTRVILEAGACYSTLVGPILMSAGYYLS